MGRQEMLCPKNLVGYSFIIRGKVWKESTSLSFLSRHRAPIISSSFRLGREFAYSYMVKLGPQIAGGFCMQRSCPRDH